MTETLLPIELREERDHFLRREELTEPEAEYVYQRFGGAFEVEWPSPSTEYRYRIRSKGYVGTFPLASGRCLRVLPKVPIASLFRVLEFAYDLPSFEVFDGHATASHVEEVFETLAALLARLVNERVRRGLHKDYVLQRQSHPFVRGRLMTRESTRASFRGSPQLFCEYAEHTAEIEDNHILAFTLNRLRRHSFIRPALAELVMRASRALSATVAGREVPVTACIDRLYHRMNGDYQAMHALCRFFLENTGPSDRGGAHDMLPFSLKMPALFESFVARWLAENCRGRFEPQFHAALDESQGLFFKIDLVLRDPVTHQPKAVLDTKYKFADKPSQSDIQQVVAYATRMRTSTAVLIYPMVRATERIGVGDVNVWLVGFDLERAFVEGGAEVERLIGEWG